MTIFLLLFQNRTSEGEIWGEEWWWFEKIFWFFFFNFFFFSGGGEQLRYVKSKSIFRASHFATFFSDCILYNPKIIFFFLFFTRVAKNIMNFELDFLLIFANVVVILVVFVYNSQLFVDNCQLFVYNFQLFVNNCQLFVYN